EIIFTLNVTNDGPSTATGVEVIENLPTGYTYISDNGGGAYVSTTGIWTIGELSNGGTATLNITCLVNATGNYTNIATVSGNEEDSDLESNEDDVSTNPTAIADLAIEKLVNNSTPNVGGEIIFTLNVTNDGPSTATGVEVIENLPTGYTYISDNGGGAYVSTTGIWTIGELSNGGTATLDITCLVNATGNYTNIATVSGNEEDSDLESNEDDVSTNPTAIADLAIEKLVNNTTPNVGDEIIFTLNVINNGPSTATGVEVIENLPTGYTYISDDGGGAYVSTTGTWTIGNLANGANESLEIICTVNASGNYTNTASVSGNEEDSDLESNEDDASTDPIPLVIIDLAIEKLVSNPTPNVGEEIVFTLNVINNGPDDATGVEMIDNLPTGYSYVSDDGGGAYISTTGIWTIGNLANGADESLEIICTVNASGNYTNTASISGNEEDFDLENNEDEASTNPIATVIIDLSIEKLVNNASPNIGEEITFTLNVINNGPDDATGVEVIDNLPTGYSYISDNGGGAYISTTGIWTIGNLANGANESLEIICTVNASGDYTNTASVSGLEEEIYLDNNEDDVSTEPNPIVIADLAIEKLVNDATPYVGDEINFTLNVINNGPDNATGVMVTENLPSGYTYVSDDGGGSFSPSTGLWIIGDLNNGEGISLNIICLVNVSGDYENTAIVTGNEDDNNIGNNTGTIATDPEIEDEELFIDLSIEKSANNMSPIFGNDIIFTIELINYGPSTATNVVVLDELLSGYEYVSDNSDGNYNHVTGVWFIGELEIDQMVSIDIIVTVLESGDYENIATVIGNEIDTDHSNNEDSVLPEPRELPLDIPNGFSPNDDGINDYFVIQGIENYPNAIITIFNRWGNIVFEAEGGYDNSWSGKNQFGITVGGDELAVGTYFYVIDLHDGTKAIRGYIYLSR
ncbi:gliding motility-associated C-terminal domain-containing protein, partial [Lentimicrobium sp. S6]|uniref:T9SS type B sorting domain-containing protein n=1 Tax=Lentimicrobium sp. S6 TaxID=2735872 RepID=UPI0015547898